MVERPVVKRCWPGSAAPSGWTATVIGAIVACADAHSATPQEVQQRDVERASVMIVCPVDEERGVGIIFATDSNRAYIATAGHVVQSCARDGKAVLVTLAGAPAAAAAQVLRLTISPLDLAVVSVPATTLAGAQAAVLPSSRLGDADALNRGDALFALGQSWFTNVTPERLARRDGATLQFESHSMRPGSSGGPLLNDRWQLVGLVHSIGDQKAEATSINAVLATIKAWNFPMHIRRLPPISAGDQVTCQLTSRGEARCWDDELIGRASTRPADLVTVTGMRLQAISVGGDHACGLDVDGAAYCWGSNRLGQLGSGSKSERNEVAVRVSGDLRFASISAGGWHSCALTADGQAYCWGAGNEGRLGNDAGEDSPVPVLVAGGLRFNSISAGTWNSCGVATDGAGYCWGGLLGTGISRSGSDPPNAFVPERVPGRFTYAAISAGGYQGETCGLTTGGAIFCWGSPGTDGSFSAKSLVQAQISGSLIFKSVHHGLGQHACGTVLDGRAYCWGSNNRGQLGNGSRAASSMPVAVSGGLAFASVVSGTFHSCGVTVEGAVYCWGALNSASKAGSAVPVKAPNIE
jgi:alpha-tubulin suppressor-like RCC1 family protein